jgi:hypothetical protein
MKLPFFGKRGNNVVLVLRKCNPTGISEFSISRRVADV